MYAIQLKSSETSNPMYVKSFSEYKQDGGSMDVLTFSTQGEAEEMAQNMELREYMIVQYKGEKNIND